MAADYLYGLYGMPIAVDNSYLLPLLEIGLPGFCLWMAALLACWVMAIRESGTRMRACLPMLVGLFFYSVFEGVLLLSVDSLSWLVYLFSLAEGEPCLTGASASGEEDDG
jgi:O-antigen ligase